MTQIAQGRDGQRAETLSSPYSGSRAALRRAAALAVQILIVLGPWLLQRSLNIPVYAQNEFQDQVFFQGILLDLSDNIARFGAQYYNVRFGAIFPELVFWKLLGPETGYLAFRWVLLAGTGLVLFHAVAGRIGVAAGLLAASLFLLSPITARMAIETYVDLHAVCFSLCALALLFFVLPSRPGLTGFAAGVLFALAVNSNFFAVVLVATGGLGYAVAHGAQPLRFHGRAIGFGLIGFALVCFFGFLVYRLAFGVDNVFAPTLRTTFRLAGGESAMWAEKDRAWLREWPYIYGPVLLLIPLALLWRKGAPRLQLALAAFALASVAGLFSYDAFLKGYALKLYWYFSYLLPAVIFAPLAAVLAAADRLPGRWRPWAAAAPVLALLVLTWFVAHGWYPLAGWAAPQAWMTGAALALVLALALRLPRRLAGVAACACTIVGVALSTLVINLGWVWGPLALYTRAHEARDWALFRAVVGLVAQLPKQGSEPGDMRFVYASALPLREALIQSAYLGPFSSFKTKGGTVVTLDKLDDDVLPQAEEYRTRFIVVMAREEEAAGKAAAWFCARGLPLARKDRFLLQTTEAPLIVTVLARQSAAPGSSDPPACGA